MALSTVIKRRMKQANMGNKELAEKAGIPLRTLNNILYGITTNPTVTAITGIAHALGCTIDELVEDMENPDRLTAKEEQLLSLFRQLNQEGQDKLIDNGRDLVASGRYIKNNESAMVGQKEA